MNCASCNKCLNNEGAGMCEGCGQTFCDDHLQEQEGKVYCSDCAEEVLYG